MSSRDNSGLDIAAAARGLAELEQAMGDRDRYRAALEEALEWVPEPERTTIAEVLR